MAAFNNALRATKKCYFDSRYKSKQLHLRILVTHPDFQRRAGSALCKWGMGYARERGEPVTLLSSPIGQKLYSYLGFDYFGTVTVQIAGEVERLAIGAMVYPTKPR